MAAVLAAGLADLALAGATGLGARDDPQRTPEQKAARRDQLVSAHNQKLQELVHDGPCVFSTCSTNVKPASNFALPLARCTPVAIADLQPGVTHRGRVLRGRLLVQPYFATAVATLLEDPEGDVVRLFMYDMLPGDLAGMEGLQAAARLLPAGQAVAVIEPYFKRMDDGSLGVRVDNPAEVVRLEWLPAADASSLQSDGLRHYTAARYSDAAGCYSRSLLHMPDAAGSGTLLLVSVLLNLAAAHLKLRQAARALQCAATAAAVQPSAPKAHYRAALALSGLGADLAARCSMQEAFARMPGGGPGAEERRRMLGELGPQQQLGEAGQADQADRMLRELAACSAHDAIAAAGATGPAAQSPHTDAASTVAAAASAKASGNDAFRSGCYEDALRCYTHAAHTMLAVLPAPALLANLAACHLHLAALREALLAATAAVVLQPGNGQAHCQRTSALLQLGWLGEAKVACACGLAVVESRETKKELRGLHKRIIAAGRMQPAVAEERDGIREGGRTNRSGVPNTGDGGSGSQRPWVTERQAAASLQPLFAPVEGSSAANMAKDVMRDPRLAGRMEQMRREDPLMWRALQKDERIAPLHEEYGKAGRLLPESNADHCIRLLWKAYELNRGMASHLLRMASIDNIDMADIRRKRALNSAEPRAANERLEWLLSAPDGAVSFRRCRAACYNPTVFLSFRNAPAAAVPMPPGGSSEFSSSETAQPRTHVAVGFVDLGTLAEAVNDREWDEHVRAAVQEAVAAAVVAAPISHVGAGDEAAAGAGARGPPPAPVLLRWVGYEASPYSVAKALVLEGMLRDGARATDEVLQVWFSAAWTRATLASFRRALAVVLREHSAAAKGRGAGRRARVLPDAVLAYLRCWQARDVGLAESRSRWLADRTQSLCCAGAFREQADRVALCDYLLTGQLPGLGRGQVGSVVMFAAPEGGGPKRAMDESFLEAIPSHELLSACCKQSASSSSTSGGGTRADVVLTGVALLKRRVRRLATLLASGRVEVQLRLCAVLPDDPATAAAIASLRPATICWSNIPDFLHPADFHPLARACSTADGAGAATVHHMHSVNWWFDVKGASHVDVLLPYIGAYDERGMGRAGIGAGRQGPPPERPKLLCERVLRMVDAGHRAIGAYLASLNADGGGSGGSGSGDGGGGNGNGGGRAGGGNSGTAGGGGNSGGAAGLLHSQPFVGNPRNIADYGLWVAHHQAWADAFFAAGGLQQQLPVRQAAVVAPPAYSPLSRVDTTMSLAFTYGDAPLAR